MGKPAAQPEKVGGICLDCEATCPRSRVEVWEKILESHAGQADLEYVCIDSTVIRAHACAAGAANSDQILEAVGRLHGRFGFSGTLLADKGHNADRLLG